jgi:hypothetical protein
MQTTAKWKECVMRRRTSSIVLAVAATTVVVSLLSLAAKPANSDPPQSTTEFTIETNQTVGTWYSWGKFSATGALKDNGEAFTYYSDQLGSTVMELTGKHGTLDLSLRQDGEGARYFTVIDGSGDYVDLVGISGSAVAEWRFSQKGNTRVYHTLTGSIAP